MAEHSLLVWIMLGALAGWLASVLVKGDGYGVFIDILIGVLGASLGGWLALLIGMGFIASLVTAVLGAIALLLMLRVLKQWMR